MEPFTRYYTIKSESDVSLDGAVEEKLNEGWTLYGSPYIDREGYYCQAVVKWVKKIN